MKQEPLQAPVRPDGNPPTARLGRSRLPRGPCHGLCVLVCTPLPGEPLRPWPAGGHVHSLSIVLALSRESCS